MKNVAVITFNATHIGTHRGNGKSETILIKNENILNVWRESYTQKKKKTISNMKTKYGSYDLRIFVFIA